MKIIILIMCLIWVFVRDSTGSTVRLINGKTPDEGIIQIRSKNKWAILAYEHQSDQTNLLMNAFVVCRMLNYTKAIKGYMVAVPNDYLKSNYTILDFRPYEFRCRGDEATIQDCRSGSTITSYIPIYAVCGNLSRVDRSLQVRLTKTKQRNCGIVEVSYKSHSPSWKWICFARRLHHSRKYADVVCKMLGYKRAIAGFFFKISHDSQWKTYADDYPRKAYGKRYRCTGREATLAGCPQNYRPSCNIKEDFYAGVFCEENPIPPPPNYRLNYKKAPNIGFLEVQHRGVWGTICPKLDRTTADFICRKLGFLGHDRFEYFQEDFPKTIVSWELNSKCNISHSGNCSHGDMWKIVRYGSCLYWRPPLVTCKVADIPKYDVISGCPPKLIINRTGLTEKEKKFITYYKVEIFEWYPESKLSSFYISANTTTLILGDGWTYMMGNSFSESGLNKPLEIGKKYYVELTAVYADKNGLLGHGRTRFGLLEVTKDCPTSPAPTIMTEVSSTSHSEHATESVPLSDNKESSNPEKLNNRIIGVVIGVLIVVLVIIVICICRKRNNQDHQKRLEHVMLHPVPEDQKAYTPFTPKPKHV